MEFSFFSYSIELWQVYVLVGILLCGFEIFAPGFVLLPIGLAFFSTAIVALFVPTFILHLAFLAISAAILLVVFRKFVQGQKSQDTKTNANSMIGQVVNVIEAINNDDNKGYIKLYGDEWRALSETGEIFQKGEKVKILKLQGNKVYVIKS